jgi:predicted site-specific integrase-resolvase
MQDDIRSSEGQELVPLAEAARSLGVAYVTAWRWAKAGRFEGIEANAAGRLFVPRPSVEAVRESSGARGRSFGGGRYGR